MLVVDASAIVDLVLEQPTNAALAARMATSEELHAPRLLDVEVLTVVRRLSKNGSLSTDAGTAAVHNFKRLPISRYPHEPFLDRIWELRDVLTAYESVYVALAEALDLTLVTSDAKLGRAHGHRATIESYAR